MKLRSGALCVLLKARWRCAAAFALLLAIIPNVVYSQQKPDQPQRPNILVIMGDDIGWFNPSCYKRGMMGYETPNIDRIAKEGALFNRWYAQQSCTAGRAAFITGQQPIRTGLTKVGAPGADLEPIDSKEPDPHAAFAKIVFEVYHCGNSYEHSLSDFLFPQTPLVLSVTRFRVSLDCQ
jgi:Sulfatase